MPGLQSAPGDKDFELTFADLAYAQLRDKAPGLLDFLLGFQVVDKNDEQTHGIGVMGFEVGEQLIYAPSFFLNGELKQPLLYIKDQDLFVPLQDNWVTYILSRKPQTYGKPEPKKEQELGVQAPDLTSLARTMTGPLSSFAYKSANWQSWANHIPGMFSRLSNRYQGLTTLPEFLKKTAEYGTSGILAKAMTEDLDFANAVCSLYKPEELLHKPAGCAKKAKKPNMKMPVKRSSLLDDPEQIFNKNGPHRVTIYKGMPKNAGLMSDKDLETLARGELLIKDAREVANVAYKADAGVKLKSPDCPGLYSILTSTGEFRDAYVIPNPKQPDASSHRAALVIDKSSKETKLFWSGDLLAKPQEEYGNKKLYDSGNDLLAPAKVDTSKLEGSSKTLFDIDGLINASSVSTGSSYVFVAPNGEATNVLYIDNKVSMSNGLTELWADNRKSWVDSVPMGRDRQRYSSRDYKSEVASPFNNNSCGPAYGPNRVVITKDNRKMRHIGDVLYIPQNAKALKVSGADITWTPSTVIDIETNLLDEGAEVVELLKKDASVYVNNKGPFSRNEVLVALVKKAGLRVNEAKTIINELRDHERSRYLVKNAVGFAPPIPEPLMGYNEYAGVQEQYPQEEVMPMYGFTTPPPENAYLGKPERQQIMEAAQTGQNEVFDTSAIAALVKTRDSDDLIAKYLGDLIKGLDRVCRILFMFYWLNSQFKERYGQENMVELEDQLKSSIKGIGDLVLFLKQRRVESSPEFDALAIDSISGSLR